MLHVQIKHVVLLLALVFIFIQVHKDSVSISMNVQCLSICGSQSTTPITQKRKKMFLIQID